MSQKNLRRVYTVYGIALSALLVIAGICLIAACISIYQSGSTPFTYERISTHFALIAVPVLLALVGVIGGIVLSLVGTPELQKTKPMRHAAVTLATLSAKMDPDACDPTIRAGLRKEQRLRQTLGIVAAAICAVAAIPPLVWCLDTTHFTIDNLNGDIIAAAIILLPCTVIGLGACVAATLLRGASTQREIALVKAAIAAGAKAPAKPSTAKAGKAAVTDSPYFLWGARCVILAVGVAFIVLGVQNGGMADVLGKAVRICTECIGLG